MKRVIAITSVAALIGAAIGAVVLSASEPAEAACLEPALCRPQQTRLDDHGFLRAASLDIRGVVPSPEEHARIEAEGIEVLIDEWLATEEFQQRVVRRHQALLWANIRNQTRLYHFRRSLSRNNTTMLWRAATQATRIEFRGGNVDCLDQPATFGADGRPTTTPGTDAEGNPVQREGYVMVEPYWAPGTQIKVCAFDAQAEPVSPTGRDCTSRAGISDAACGCGPNLRWCHTSTVRNTVLAAFNEELDLRVASHIARDEPYHELLTSRTAYVNGPLSTFWRFHSNISNQLDLVPDAIDMGTVPMTDADLSPGDLTAAPATAMHYADEDRWEEIMLPEQHAGLLTHPAYLLRFQTNRARANRFFNAFLCEPFQPPEGGIDLEDPVANLNPDVQQRPGCAYCHALLEPAAAHWGRWREQGGGYLTPELFPEYRDDCADCGRGLETCNDECRFNYVVRALSPEEEPYLGGLRAFQFLRDEHRANVEAGPAGLVRQGVADGRFTSCAVRNTAEWLFGRALSEEEEPLVRQVTSEFLVSDFRYRELVKAIVMSETYRRAL